MFPISRPAVSRHLRVLRDAGLVRPLAPARTSRSTTFAIDGGLSS